ncbi:glycosyltransferase involved in cell wall biosynthesis [Pedobacter sp. CG_S7]|uniref:glycosyltransferase n=1 Tax=Pedobacter sp. CG_S7 TaxID=3143930 RepID=UPI003393DD28
MKLGFYLEAPIMTSPKNVNYCADTYMLLLPKLLKDNLEISMIAKGLDYNEKLVYYQLDPCIEITKIGSSESIFSLLKNYRKYLNENLEIIDNYLNTIDHLVLATGGPLTLVFIKRAIKKKIPCTLLVRANARKTIPTRFRGVKKLLAFLTTNYIESRVDNLCRKNNLGVIALGKELFSHYNKLTNKCILFSSSKYSKADIIDAKEISDIDWQSPVKFLFVGRLVVNKGLNELINALSYIKNYDWSLTIVGTGEYENEIKKLIHKLKLTDRIHLKGNVPFGNELKYIYRDHDVVVLPSYFEGLPQVILEGMANGCLILATNVGGIPGVINNNQNGFLFEPRSINEIVKTLNILPNVQNLTNVRINALEIAIEYAQENQINNFYNILK